jgi:hypothetical protein
MHRKPFLRQTGTLGAAGMMYPSLCRIVGFILPKPNDAVGLQLYTPGGLMESDAKGTLQKLAAFGYKNVESASGSKGLYMW